MKRAGTRNMFFFYLALGLIAKLDFNVSKSVYSHIIMEYVLNSWLKNNHAYYSKN